MGRFTSSILIVLLAAVARATSHMIAGDEGEYQFSTPSTRGGKRHNANEFQNEWSLTEAKRASKTMTMDMESMWAAVHDFQPAAQPPLKKRVVNKPSPAEILQKEMKELKAQIVLSMDKFESIKRELKVLKELNEEHLSDEL